MRTYERPGVFFIGTLPYNECAYLTRAFREARVAGYRRFVEPACGVFAMTQIALAAGWRGEECETSDVSLLSSVLGYALTGRDLAELQIETDGIDIDPTDPAQVLWAFELARFEKRKIHYYQELALDLQARRAVYEASLRSQLESMKALFRGVRYEPRDLFEHLEAVKDDPQALIGLNPPTIRRGYERFFDVGGRIRWKEPRYEVFSPADGHARLAQLLADSKALIIIYAETDDPKTLPGERIFARGMIRKATKDPPGARSINSYLYSNRPHEVAALAGGRAATRYSGLHFAQPKWPSLPPDHQYGKDSHVQVVPITSKEAAYYRALWTHNFVGQRTNYNEAVLVDGFVVGIFGLSDKDLRHSMAEKLVREADMGSIWYSIPCPDRRQRWGRLLTRLELSRPVLANIYPPIVMAHCERMNTTMLTRHPEAKEHRGLMKLMMRKKHAEMGYRLSYSAPLHDKDIRACWLEFLEDDARWQQRRSQTSAMA
jgi:hypothetical protein